MANEKEKIPSSNTVKNFKLGKNFTYSTLMYLANTRQKKIIKNIVEKIKFRLTN